MTKFAIIIEGSWCGVTHIHSFHDSLYKAIIAVRDWIDEQTSYDENKTATLLKNFADNDFTLIEDVLVIDEIEINI